jgi:hypothetical protein
MGTDESDDQLTAVTSKVSDQLKEQIDAARMPEESRSAAIRRLIRVGLDAQETEGWYDRSGRAVTLAFLMGYPTLAGLRGELYTAVGFIVLIASAALFEPWLTAAIGRIPNPASWLNRR